MAVWDEAGQAERPERTSDLLVHLAETARTKKISVGALIDTLSDRAFGVIMLVLAIPCCLPFLYGIPQVVSVPMIFVAAQIVMGRHTLWMPKGVRKRSFTAKSFGDMARRAKRYLGWAESISHPRLSFLTRGLAVRIFGLCMLIFSLSIAVPLPLTNTVPGFAVAVMSVGFIERDGLFVIVGTIIGTLWVSALVLAAGLAAVGITTGLGSFFGM